MLASIGDRSASPLQLVVVDLFRKGKARHLHAGLCEQIVESQETMEQCFEKSNRHKDRAEVRLVGGFKEGQN